MIDAIVSVASTPGNGRVPDSISNNTHPNAQMSAPLVHRHAPRLLGTHITGGAKEHPDAGHHRGRGDRRRCRQVGPAAGFRLHELGEPEIQHLHSAIWTQLDVRGLQVTMDDPVLVRRRERVGNLSRDR